MRGPTPRRKASRRHFLSCRSNGTIIRTVTGVRVMQGAHVVTARFRLFDAWAINAFSFALPFAIKFIRKMSEMIQKMPDHHRHDVREFLFQRAETGPRRAMHGGSTPVDLAQPSINNFDSQQLPLLPRK